MNNVAYGSAYIETCARRGHHFKSVGSDKTPMKLSLICITCSDQQNKSVYVAYGTDVGSFGQWRKREDSHSKDVA